MAYTTINKSRDHFNTKIYTGNGYDNNAITGVGFQPDFSWIKNRSGTSSHLLTDVLTGVGKRLRADTNGALGDQADGLKSFDSDGFTLGTTGSVNTNSSNYVAWNWKAGGSGSANSVGDITSTVSANTTAGFSLVKFTANGTNNGTIGHGLGAEPKIIFYKRTDSTGDWYVVYKYVDGSLDFMKLNANDAKVDLTLSTYGFASSTTFTNLGFGNSQEYIAYCFAEKKGFSKFGTYKGNGNSDGTFVYTGFKPQMVIGKRFDGSEDWFIFDTARDDRNIMYKLLYGNVSNAEYTGAERMDFYSNGFKQYNTDHKFNGNGMDYLYMAFGQTIVGDNDQPCVAR